MNIWKPIPAFENYYASVTGEVLSLVNEKPLILKQSLDSKGYPIVNIQSKVRRVHRLIANAFLDLRYEETETCVLHRDDIPSNNNLSNLTLGSQADNIADMHSKGRYKKPAMKISDQDVALLRQRLLNGEKGNKLANEYKVSPALISHIKTGARRAG